MNQSTPSLTMIVPGFDVAAFAAEAIESLRVQSFTDWQAILIDDASTDATADVFAAATERDPRFRLVRHARRRGLAAARNTGLDLVDSPYLGFLDSDDVLAPRALERLVTVLSQTRSDFVVGAYVRLRPDGPGPGAGYSPGVVQQWVAAATDPARRGTTIDQHPEASGNIVAWSKVSRTDFWRRAGLRFPDGRLYEDQLVAQRMYSAARAFDVVPEVVVHWRERADGSSITQHKGELSVLREYLAAMTGGIEVLRSAGHAAAVQARAGLILRMDVPPLVELAREHPDAAYRAALGAFVRDVWDAAAEPARATLDEASVAGVSLARTW